MPKNPAPTSSALWVLTNRPYENHIFHSAVFMAGVLYLGAQTFGFGIASLSAGQNLLLNFFWYLALVVLLACCPTLCRMVMERFFPSALENPIYAVDAIDDDEVRETLLDYLDRYGMLPPNTLQIRALVTLFCIWLFELFFIGAWVGGEDYHLVWQPIWAQNIIDWMKEHTILTGGGRSGKFFWLDVPKGMPVSIETLFQSPITDSAVLLHFFRLLFCIPICICLVVVLWKIIYAAGLFTFELNSGDAGIGRLIWNGVATLVLLFVGSASAIIYLAIDTVSMLVLDGSQAWLGGTMITVMLLLHALLGLWMLYGWFVFWKLLIKRRISGDFFTY